MAYMKKSVGMRQKYDREVIVPLVCEELRKGKSLQAACQIVPVAPSPDTFLDWVKDDPLISQCYAQARDVGYKLLADEIVAISDENFTTVEYDVLDDDGKPVLDAMGQPVRRSVKAPLSSDAIARNRLRIDTRKWMLAKMLPKLYGEKVTQEHTGADGGPIKMAAVDLRNLNDDELEKMQLLLTKAAAGGGGPV